MFENSMCITLLLLFAQAAPDVSPLPWGGTDFLQYYAANQLLLVGKNPYDRDLNAARQAALGRVGRIETYTPPWGFLPALPLSWLSYPQAVQVNIGLNGLLLVVCSFWWTQLLFPKQKQLIVFSVVSLPLWMPCLAVLGIGQLSLWPLVGITGWLWFTSRHSHRSAGSCLVLLIIKPHLGLLLGVFAGIYTLRRRRWKTIFAFILSLIFLTLLTLVLRPTIWSDYLEMLQTSPPLTHISTATLGGWGQLYLGRSIQFISWSIWALALVVAGMTGWYCGRNSTPNEELNTEPSAGLTPLISWSAILCVASVAVVPYAFSFDFVLMLPGFILMVGLAVLKQDRRWWIALAVWFAMELWLVYGKLVPWTEAAYCLVPWVGLGVTVWLLRRLCR